MKPVKRKNPIVKASDTNNIHIIVSYVISIRKIKNNKAIVTKHKKGGKIHLESIVVYIQGVKVVSDLIIKF